MSNTERRPKSYHRSGHQLSADTHAIRWLYPSEDSDVRESTLDAALSKRLPPGTLLRLGHGEAVRESHERSVTTYNDLLRDMSMKATVST